MTGLLDNTVGTDPTHGTRVPIQTEPAMRGTSLLVEALGRIQLKLKTGQFDAAENRLGELLAAVQIDSAPFVIDVGRNGETVTSGPQPRSEREVLISIAQLLEEVLAETKRTNARLGVAAEERCSFEIDSNASAGKLKAKGKSYGATMADAREAAHLEFVTEMAALEIAQALGWATTLEALRAQQEPVG